ncbi:WbuC family cupin fold metalloprotein [Methylocystis bryophila]|uniref:Cupin fold metalloprotein WbuC cupin domain-containing protein n=1 Tax=Methylocystis bryophila TaxID=655015 RepID=A0A1W6N073_9HYPH|nr:WbuC family cupin fold metalloprotein [Methylocystis bryophila]ARN83225.1 hypothetical protein B1812_21475 [Methylocystis bryophila]BDV39567.1 hypothetical protein DSM21852_28200 [Methylocystis bryophila]
MNLQKRSESVFVAQSAISQITKRELTMLREAARTSPRRRARINLHSDDDDLLHEMIIAIARDSYIRPHRHPGKSESFHLIEGAVDVVVFDDAGAITQIVSLDARGGEAPFYYRMSRSLFHTIIVRSELLVMHEVTNGPFRPNAAVYAPFAPAEEESGDVAAYTAELMIRVAAHGNRAS